jgi:serine/threonine protein kinase
MQSEDWHRVEELLNTALELEPGARRKFLDALDAPTLRREVESLLVFETESDSFLSAPALAFSSDFFEDNNGEDGERAGQAIGRYRIIKEIGRGGMGAVYLAERADDAYQQHVAVKVIKRGFDTDEVRRRFRNERQILACLEHPNIARLLDGGTTEDGLSYFVMEYVEGQPLNEYADAHRLSTVERLKLFRIICAAVTHAHQNLVVHRDLKPSNILVTSEGTPKLLDFGIAKLLHGDSLSEAETMTATNLRVLTPEYASPEQVRGLPVTTATDVYSLGVLLYELLTGHRPYRLKNRHPQEIERVICEEQPDRPSIVITHTKEAANEGSETRGASVTPQTVSEARETTPDKLRRRLAGDLDNIVLMAMRKEPSRRYASVGQFSEDIRWHLEGLPVLARKDTFSYRASKFVNRNKLDVAAAAPQRDYRRRQTVATPDLARQMDTRSPASAQRISVCAAPSTFSDKAGLITLARSLLRCC